MKLARPPIAALAVSLLASTVPAALAQDGRLVAFGDSLSDNGNLFLLSGGAAPPYPSRRFSNGLTYAELLAGPMLNFPLVNPSNVNSGNVNYAVGGSRTSGPMTPGPTTAQQVGLFLATGGRFAANDVASLYAGANNLFQGIPVAAANPATAVATVTPIATGAPADIGAQVTTLSDAGARTILVPNLPNFSSLPQFTTGAGAAANGLAGAASGTFNAALLSTLQGVSAARPATNVILVDVNGLFDAARANPAAFGFSNVTQACIRVASCLGAAPAVQNTYLFWDDVHPTEAAYRLVAQAAAQYFFAPARGGAIASALGETSLALRRQRGLDAFSDLDRADVPTVAAPSSLRFTADLGVAPVRGPTAAAVLGWTYFVDIVGDAIRGDAGAAASAFGLATAGGERYDLASGGVRFGGVRRLSSDWTIGVTGSVVGGEIDISRLGFSANVLSLGADAAARWQSGPFFVRLGLGASFDHFTDYEQRFGIGNLTNEAKARAVATSAVAEAGLNHAFGALTLTPLARLAYYRSDFESFSEAGVIAPLAFSGRTTDAVAAAVELKASFVVTDALSAHALIGYEGHLAASGGGLTTSFVGGSGSLTNVALRDPVGPGVQFGAGLEAGFGGWTARLTYRGAYGEDDQVRHSARLGVATRF